MDKYTFGDNTPYLASLEGGLIPTPEYAATLLGLSSVADLEPLAKDIARANPFGVDRATVKQYLKSHGYTYAESAVEHSVMCEVGSLSGSRVPLRLDNMSDVAWRKLTRARVCESLKRQVESGDITSVSAHRDEFFRLTALTSDISDDVLWRRLRNLTGAEALMRSEKAARQSAEGQAKAEREAKAKAAARAAKYRANQQEKRAAPTFNITLTLPLTPAQHLRAAALLLVENAALSDHLNKLATKLEQENDE